MKKNSYVDMIRLKLASGPQTARQLAEYIKVSQPTIARALAFLNEEIVTIGAARSIQYALRDTLRGFAQIPIYKVDEKGKIYSLGILIPVRPEGFVMCQSNGVTIYNYGLPWWLFDMRPQGYLGRAFVARYGVKLELPSRLLDWSDTHALRSLLAYGHDVVGNLLLGDEARHSFLTTPTPLPIKENQKPKNYARLALEAARGDQAGSSAGGEQPKFTTYAMTVNGPRHLIVKFSELEKNVVSERWRDLLLAEHYALEILKNAGMPAAKTNIVDYEGQRFLEVERFDRVEVQGRCGLISLAALDAEFVGEGFQHWPMIARRLVALGHIRSQSVELIERMWAFGSLIGNTDMHHGNLSFLVLQGRPYDVAPAYDMCPMAFAPRSGGGLCDTLLKADIHSSVSNAAWQWALKEVQIFLQRLKNSTEFSQRFTPCIVALEKHIDVAKVEIGKLG